MNSIKIPVLPPFNGLGSKSPTSRRRREKQEFFKKYSPLTSTIDATEDDATIRPTEINLFVLDPTSKQAYHWLIVVAIATTYFCWSITLRSAFSTANDVGCYLWITLDTVFGVVYFIDFFIQMHTSYLRDGILEQNAEKLRLIYTQSQTFKLDLLSFLPLDWVYIITFWKFPPPLLHIMKLLKIYRLIQFFIRTETRSHYPNTCRVLFLMHNLLVIIHWNACCYYLFSQWIGMGSDPWVYPTWNLTHNTEWGRFSRQYVYSFYWSTLTLTTIGELSHPHTNPEYLFMTLEYLIGILMFATLVGNIGSIMENVQRNRTLFQNKMDNIKTYMKTTQIPENLQERVIKWFDYLWSYGHPMSEQHALDALPDKLKAEIGIHVHFETLKKVDFFEKCDQSLLWEIVLRLRTQVYSPGELVCRKGDVGREMYIVNSGKLEVLGEENGAVIKELKHGEYFGEISVLNLGLGKSQRRRTAFVRSLGYTSLLCLTQSDLLEVLHDYPKTKRMLIMKSKKKLQCEPDSIDENTPLPEYPTSESTDTDESIPIPLIEDEVSFSCYQYPPSDSDDLNDKVPPKQLHTIADEVIDLKDRLSQIENLIREVLGEIKKDSFRHSETSNSNKSSTLYTIQERIRKLSSQF